MSRKIITVVGTRPELIKMSLVIEKLDTLSQHVLVPGPLPLLAVRPLLQDAQLDQLPQSGRRHRLGHSDPAGELVEPTGPVQRLSQHEQGRSAADRGKCLVDRAARRRPAVPVGEHSLETDRSRFGRFHNITLPSGLHKP